MRHCARNSCRPCSAQALALKGRTFSGMSVPRFTIHLCTWQDAEAPLRAIRTQVFIQEQNVPEALEWDGEDAQAVHVLACDNSGRAIGSARLLLHHELAHIGRMAVLPEWRGQGVGRALIGEIMAAAQARGASRAFLNAQTTAVPFYARAGFMVEGEEFLDAGIPHLRMTRSL
jgi:predicted GNAT family N-acyltransferase